MEDLYRENINPVVSLAGEGPVLYGDKTLLSKPSAFDRINVRRLFILLEKAIANAAKFQLFEFKRLPLEYIVAFCEMILKTEKIKYDVDSIKKVVAIMYPDIRKIINTLQARSRTGSLISSRTAGHRS